MNIGVDVDGTLSDISRFQLENGKRHFGRAPADPDAYDVDKMFSCSELEKNIFWARYLFGYCTEHRSIKGAAGVIKRLHDEGNGIYMITSRIFTSGSDPVGLLFRKMLIGWLRRNRVVYDDIAFCENTGESKLEACMKLRIGVMIDDSPENLLKVSEKTNVICYPMPWNKGIEDKGIIRARDWKDIYRIIRSMEGTTH